jgi:hypothetical protein
MNQSKFESVFRGMTMQAKKVYECVPISESWTPAQIMGELHRRNVSMSDKHVVMGCLNSMIDSGIVNEVSRGEFKREAIRPKCDVKVFVSQVIEPIQEPEVKKPNPAPAPVPTPAPGNPLDLLGEFAQRLRALADDAERIAMAIASQAEKNDAETAKMRQLQALLKSLG